MEKAKFEEFIDKVREATGIDSLDVFSVHEEDRTAMLRIPRNHWAIAYFVKASKPKQTAKEFIEALCKEHDLKLEQMGNRGKAFPATVFVPHLNVYDPEITCFCPAKNSEYLGCENLIHELIRELAIYLSGKEAVIHKPNQPLEVIQIPEFKE